MIKINETAIAYTGLIVSVITAVALIYNSWETREHNRRIVTPMVLANISSSSLNEELGIYLKNEGIGPAQINYKEVLLDGRSSSLPEVISQMTKEGLFMPDSEGSYMNLGHASYLGQGSKIGILVFAPKSVQKSAFQEFDRFIHRRINIRYEWCSVYDECRDECTAIGCKP